MCGGAEYLNNDELMTVYFPNPNATLPVLKRGGHIEQVPWGRRKQQTGTLPLGGWARLDSIHAGRWDRWQPTAVKIPLQRFMEKDRQKNSHWFDVTKGKWVQGLVARYQGEQRVYVVTIEPQRPDAIHDRWPRILS